ncbi:MAG TPA: hypothetical protein VK104_08515, partial [Burkholderiaceae bacterium]|nr:hypothetical protein [Burkholderiaceae bacterium]
MSFHHSHRPDIKPSLVITMLLAFGVVLIGMASETLRDLHIPHHLGWHMVLETLSLCLSAMIFVLVFSLRTEPL